MTALPHQSLRLEPMQEDHVVVLGCETCALTVELRTCDVAFAAAVQAFFGRHGSCAASINLT